MYSGNVLKDQLGSDKNSTDNRLVLNKVISQKSFNINLFFNLILILHPKHT